MSIPYTSYIGGLRQLNTDFNLPIMKDCFEQAFSGSSHIGEVYHELQNQGVKRIITAAGTQEVIRGAHRRFAGDLSLPQNRYFTLCNAEDFNDHGTLRDEIYAYFRGSAGVDVKICDPKEEVHLTDALIASGQLASSDAQYPFLFFIYEISRETVASRTLLRKYPELKIGETFAITYGVRQAIAKLHKVIDLRIPDVQEWFVKTFVDLEIANREVFATNTNIRFLSLKKAPECFAELLPVIVSLETGGGGTFGQAIGCWLRQQGADGLIFPGARSNAQCRVLKGNVVESKGWNCVLYVNAPIESNINMFGRSSTWFDSDHDHIRTKYVSDGEEKGSLSVRGPREWNLLAFDLQRQVAQGIRTISPIAEMTGTKNYELTVHTKSLLRKEEENDTLWFHDINCSQFLQWHEKHWKRAGK